MWIGFKLCSGYSAPRRAMYVLLLLLCGCAAGRQARGPAAAAPTEQSEAGTGNEAITEALKWVSDGQWRDLHLRVECHGPSGRETLTIFGSGAAIWRDRTQFFVPRPAIQSVADRLLESGFGDMSEIYGGKDDPKEPEKWALRVLCLVSVAIDGQSKQVTQLEEGHQEERFKELARDLLARFEAPARDGVGAENLQDALEKIARRQLAPEALRLQVHRRPEDLAAAEGWLLRVGGAKATTQLYDGAVLLPPARLALGPDAAASLAMLLAEAHLDDLPGNLYAEYYTDLVVEVLSFKKNIQARQFARMTPATHGDRQQRYDALFEGLRRLHLQVLESQTHQQ